VICFRTAVAPLLPHQLRWMRVLRSLRGSARLSILLLAGCLILPRFVPQSGAQSLPPDAATRTIRGTVVNSVSQAPIGRALVQSQDGAHAVLTDSQGHFEFEFPQTNIETDNSGFVASSGPVASDFLGNPIFLMARRPGFLEDSSGRIEALPGSDVTIPLVPEALIVGRIISSSEAAAGVNVQLFSRLVQDGRPRWIQNNATRTNSNGEFRFAELPRGIYKLSTGEWMDNDPTNFVPGGQLHGYPPIFYPGLTDFAAAGTIQLMSGQTAQADITLIRQPYYPVSIPVLNVAENTGVNITVSVQGHRGPGYSLGYDPQKQTIVGQLPSGNYVVEAATFGPVSSSGAVNLSVAGAGAEGPPLALAPNASISVNVTEQFTAKDQLESQTWSVNGKSFEIRGPRRYLNVNVESTDEFALQRNAGVRPPTGANDEAIVLENLAPGNYWLRFHSNRGYVAAVTMGGVDLLREPLIVTRGSNTPIEITMRDDSAELEVTAPNDAPNPELPSGTDTPYRAWKPTAVVYCVPLPDGPGEFTQLGFTRTESETKFVSQNMAPGDYRVLASKTDQPDLPYRDAESMKAYEAKGPVVHLTAGQKTTLQLPGISEGEPLP
jgi:hypothetical protein